MAFENRKQIFIIIGALAAGLLAAFLMAQYIQSTTQRQAAYLEEKYHTQQVQMVQEIQSENEQKMAAMAQELQKVRADDQAQLSSQMAALKEQLQQAQARGQGVAAKQAVRHPSLALRTPVGKRAVTVKIDSLAAVGGLINAGDIVDVIAELNAPAQDSDKQTVTAMIFQDLQVLAVNTNEDDPGAYDEQQSAASLKITFAVDPQEAGLLAFANKNGTLELALRSPEDTDRQTVKADTWKTLADYVLKNQGPDLDNPDEIPANKPEEVKPSIQIFRGGKEL